MIAINRSKKFTEFFDKKTEARKIDFVVLHHIEASSAQHAVSMLQEYQVSSHFLIDEGGNIFELVDENDVAYHAGVSFWHGFEGLNQNSIGIEFINSSPFGKKFEDVQMQAGVELCQYLLGKYNLKKQDVVGHSDIAYDRQTNVLDRKQDPSHLFDWKFLAQNGVGIFPEISVEDKVLFELGNKASLIVEIKNNLKKFGYRLLNLTDEFDEELQAVVRVFNRRFNPQKFSENPDVWYVSSQAALEVLAKDQK
jgi:N-acetylmuramoyl-L-alanine amidase